jgi:hypothetical protein
MHRARVRDNKQQAAAAPETQSGVTSRRARARCPP